MKKLFLTLVLAVMGFTAAMADDATTLVATLNHGGALTAYYGKGALVDAYKAASNGDVITLSAGTFTATNIVKEITVRGAGMLPEANTNNGSTLLEGNFNITLSTQNLNPVFEGLVFTSSTVTVNSNGEGAATFNKIYLHVLTATQKAALRLNNCVVGSSLTLYGGICQNCCIKRVYSFNGGIESNIFQNCTIMGFRDMLSDWDRSFFRDGSLTNCLLIDEGNYGKLCVQLPSNIAARNCVGFSSAYDESFDIFANISDTSNKMVTDRDNFFKDSSILVKSAENDYGQVSYNVSWNIFTPDNHGLFELSDEAVAQYTGNDGTVVGVWGGAHPFNLRPVGPWINKCEIVPRVGDDGKLNVTIEVAQ